MNAFSDGVSTYDSVWASLLLSDPTTPNARWSFNFNTENAPTETGLQTGIIYTDSVFYGTMAVGYQSLCAQTNGSFRFDTFSVAPGNAGGGLPVTGLTAVFAFTCEGTPGTLVGCLHYANTDAGH